jgi:hypothetical protein
VLLGLAVPRQTFRVLDALNLPRVRFSVALLGGLPVIAASANTLPVSAKPAFVESLAFRQTGRKSVTIDEYQS